MQDRTKLKRGRRRHGTALVAVVALLAGLTVAIGLGATPAGASHYRANQLTWVQTTGNTVEFEYSGSWRCTFFFSPCSSATIGETFFPGSLDFGDGTGVGIEAEVTSIDAVNDVISGVFETDHTYPTSGPYVASEGNCCRLSSPQHINNPDGSSRIETIVDTGKTSASAESSISPIVDCALNAVCSFAIPAIDPDGQAVRYRFSTNAESGIVYQPGPPYATSAATINATTGVYSWNTTGATLSPTGSTFYSTQVTIENLTSTGAVASKTAVDFFIRLGSNSTNQQPQFVTPTPADGSTITVNLGSPVSFSTKATDPDTTDTVTLGMLGKPAAATYTTVPGNPANGTFTWTPTAIGQTILTITAQDQSGLGATPRSIVIDVVGGPPPDTTPPACALATKSATGITVQASDAGSGLASIVVNQSKNATVTVPTFTSGSTANVIVVANKIKLTSSSSVQLTVTDVAGNRTVCDPITAIIAVGASRTFSGVAPADHYLTVSDAAGVTAVVVETDAGSQVLWAPDGSTVDLGDLGSGTVKIRVLGTAGESALIMVWDGKG